MTFVCFQVPMNLKLSSLKFDHQNAHKIVCHLLPFNEEIV